MRICAKDLIMKSGSWNVTEKNLPVVSEISANARKRFCGVQSTAAANITII